MESRMVYKFEVNPKLMTEVGDSYHRTLITIYGLFSKHDIPVRITGGDKIESCTLNENQLETAKILVTELYSLYPELRKAPILYMSMDNWTPVMTSMKLEYDLGIDIGYSRNVAPEREGRLYHATKLFTPKE